MYGMWMFDANAPQLCSFTQIFKHAPQMTLKCCSTFNLPPGEAEEDKYKLVLQPPLVLNNINDKKSFKKDLIEALKQ